MKRQSMSSQSSSSPMQTMQAVSSASAPIARSSRFAVSVITAGVLAVGLAACSSPSPQAIDYKTAGRANTKANPAAGLATPPDLMADQRTQTDTPANGDASVAGYQASTGTQASGTPVLPQNPNIHIQTDGSQRWLVVSSLSRDQVWAQLRTFWQAQGFFLTQDDESRGIMQTDWQQIRPQLNQGIIRNTLSMAVANAYVGAERNRYRTRLEPGQNGTTYVFISQQGLHEMLVGTNHDSTEWQPRANDPTLEAEYLARLQRAIETGPAAPVVGPEAVKRAQEAAQKKTLPPLPAAVNVGAGANPSLSSATTLPAGATAAADGTVDLGEDYDHAWARVGGALDRMNFTVDSRDKAQGLYSIRYVDPNDFGTDAQGFWNQLFHGKKEKVAHPFNINVKALTESQTRIAVLDPNGRIDTSPLAQRIMRLLVGAL